MLQQAVSKSASRRADVEANKSCRVDREFLKRSFQLEPTAADEPIFRRITFDPDLNVDFKAFRRFVYTLLINKYGTRQTRVFAVKDRCVAFS
jgi:hypothetical protein